MAKRKQSASMELTHAGRGAKLTLGVGRRGQLVLAGKATFTPEEFKQWLRRATWYVHDLEGLSPASSENLKAGPSTNLSELPEQTSFLHEVDALDVRG